MNTKNKLLHATTLVAAGSLMSLQASAATVESLVQAGNYQQAYQQGLAQMDAREGEATFDMAFATAALRSGHYEEAVFAFERILVMDPGNADARIGLAEALLGLNDLKQARVELGNVNEGALSGAQRGRVEGLEQRVRQQAQADRSKSRAWIGFDFGYDSNVNAGTNSASFTNNFFGTGPFALTDIVRKKSAYFHQTQLGGLYEHRLDEKRKLDVIAQGIHRENMGEDRFDTRSVRINGGYSVDHKGDIYRVSVRLERDDFASDHDTAPQRSRDRLRDTVGILGQHTSTGAYAWNRGWTQTLTTGMAFVDYKSTSSRTAPTSFSDVYQYMVALKGQKEIGDFRHTLRGTLIYEQAQDEVRGAGAPPVAGNADHNARRFLAAGWRAEYLNLGSMRPQLGNFLPAAISRSLGSITPYSDLNVAYSRYNGPHVIANEVRKQTVYSLRLGANLEWSKDLRFSAEYSNRLSESTVDIYDYNQQVFKLGVLYYFM